MPRNPHPALHTLWQRVNGGEWIHVHTNTEDVVVKAEKSLRAYIRDQGVSGHEVVVLPAGEQPVGKVRKQQRKLGRMGLTGRRDDETT